MTDTRIKFTKVELTQRLVIGFGRHRIVSKMWLSAADPKFPLKWLLSWNWEMSFGDYFVGHISKSNGFRKLNIITLTQHVHFKPKWRTLGIFGGIASWDFFLSVYFTKTVQLNFMMLSKTWIRSSLTEVPGNDQIRLKWSLQPKWLTSCVLFCCFLFCF